MKSILSISFILFFSHILLGQNSQEDLPKTKDTSVLNVVDSPPEYIGGEIALYTFIYQRLRLPFDAQMRECTVYVGFIVNENGSLSDISVKKGFGKDYNEAAVRVVEAMPKWRAGSHQGELRKVAWTLPIRFKLD
jgi:periplasmic protein TonB